jgi:type I restriction enzyme, R subunit
MSIVGQPERATQDRVVALFRNELSYRYLGDWTGRNSNIEEGLLSTWLTGPGYSAAQIGVIQPGMMRLLESWRRS